MIAIVCRSEATGRFNVYSFSNVSHPQKVFLHPRRFLIRLPCYLWALTVPHLSSYLVLLFLLCYL